jgi:hypothetical protein
MPEYKRQHFLPVAYLKNFSSLDAQCARQSKLWRIDQTQCLHVPVSSQCFGKYLFSKADPKKSEESFQKIEKGYAAAMIKVWNDQCPTAYEYFTLMLAAFDFLTRNITHENCTSQEGIYAYKQRMTSFLNRVVFKNISSNTLTLDEMHERLKENWKVRLFRSPDGLSIITSDNPVMHFQLDKNNEASDCILFPLTPSICAAIFDKQHICACGNVLQESDLVHIIKLLASQCNECLYASKQPNETELATLQCLIRDRSKPISVTDSEKWEFDTPVMPRPDIFSFIRPNTI